MILSFLTQLNGKKTHFVEKIIKCFDGKDMTPEDEQMMRKAIDNGYFDLSIYDENLKPKLHTIRQDKNNRWHRGTMIDFFINARQKNMFRFAPSIPVVSTQRVFMTYAYNDIIEITIDGTYINNTFEFAQNDGFDNWEDFFSFFYPLIKASPDECYRGKLIHWTDLKY